jgi:hypothetical protein
MEGEASTMAAEEADARACAEEDVAGVGAKIPHDELVRAVLARYEDFAWVTAEKVAECSGWGGGRIADGVALGLYESRGFELIVFEAKATRGDFLAELKDPAKAEAFAALADRFVIVAPGPEVAKVEELPPTWGLTYVKRTAGGYRCRDVRKGPLLRRGTDPAPLPRAFVGALVARRNKAHKRALARFDASVPVAEIEERLREHIGRREAEESPATGEFARFEIRR